MSGLGSMMAGGNPASGERQEDDFYPTPAGVTEAFCQSSPGKELTPFVWEPFCGDWAMASVLEKHGYKVIGSDINPRDPRGRKKDFLKTPLGRARPSSFSIVSNPPFNLAVKAVEHAIALEPWMIAFVLKSTWWHAVGRLSLFERHPPKWIMPLTWRPDFLNKGRPTMEVSWVVWQQGYTGFTRYQPLRRPS
jgi:hypothetical protein